MSNLQLIFFAKIFIAICLSYFPIVALSGFFAAWVAKKFGDHTAENEGLLTLNPLAQAKFSGLVILLLYYLADLPFLIGLGHHTPINEQYIDQPWRKFKYLIALCAKSLMNIFLFVGTTGFLILLFRLVILPLDLAIKAPALISALVFFLQIFKNINLISALMEFIFGLVFFVISILFPNITDENPFLILLVQISLVILAWYFIKPYIGLFIFSLDRWVMMLGGIKI